jgi:Flp pilus assembly protein TadD
MIAARKNHRRTAKDRPSVQSENNPNRVAKTDTIAVPLREVLGVAQEYLDSGRPDAAERMLGHVLAALPGHADALHMQGLICFRRQQGPQALALMERAVAAQPQRALFWRSLSDVCRMHGDLGRSLAAARRAVALDPADALALFTLAMVHHDLLDLPACIAAARASLDLKPALPQAHMKLGQALLLTGELQAGWEEYEWRYRIPGAAPLMPAELLAPEGKPGGRPQWDGTPMPDTRLLLVADQGYGDVIQFARYIPWARALCPLAVIAASADLAGLLATMFPGLEIVTNWQEAGKFAAYCPLSGLPRLHGTTLDNIPAAIPYITSAPDRVAHWRGLLDALLPPGLPRVGLVWAGRPTHNNDLNRSLSLDRLTRLTDMPGVAFVSLQKGPAARQASQHRILDLDDRIAGFDDTAAIIANLDLVIGVDTAVMHLAGAMGRPAWVLLPHAPDWRWLLDRTDSPWYPSMRLFRPPAPRAWDAVVDTAAQHFSEFLAGRPA